jgi:hypothetical protein
MGNAYLFVRMQSGSQSAGKWIAKRRITKWSWKNPAGIARRVYASQIYTAECESQIKWYLVEEIGSWL